MTRRQLFKNLFLTAGALTVGREAQGTIQIPSKHYPVQKYPFPNYLQMSALVKVVRTDKPTYYPDGSIEIAVEALGVSNVGSDGFKVVIYFMALTEMQAANVLREFLPDKIRNRTGRCNVAI